VCEEAYEGNGSGKKKCSSDVTEREFVNSLNGHFNCFYRMTMAAMAMKPKYIMAHLHPSRGSIKLSTPVEKCAVRQAAAPPTMVTTTSRPDSSDIVLKARSGSRIATDTTLMVE
jgi:hypothetical protein